MTDDFGGKLMKYSSRGAAILMLLTSMLLFPKDNQRIKIGECHWYTGQNRFEDILAIAKKNAKPVLVFYSASWCGPCQRIRKNVLAAREFLEVEREAILLFIEFTEKGGKEFTEKQNIVKFPTLTLFSPEGVDLDTGAPDENVPGILHWVKQVKIRGELIKHLAKNPTDWDALFRATKKIKESMYTSSQHVSNIALLRNALEASDNRDERYRRRAFERLADYLYLTMMAKKGARSRNYAEEHNEEFTNIIRSYYPDKFRYELKKRNPLNMWITWLTRAGDYKTSVRVFEEYRSRMAGSFDTGKNVNLLAGMIKSYLSLGLEQQAEIWISRVETSFADDLKKGKLESPPLVFIRILLDIIEYKYNDGNKPAAKSYIAKLQTALFVTGKEIDGGTLYKFFAEFEKVIEFFYHNDLKVEVKKVAITLKRMINSFEDDSCKTFITIRLAKKYGVFVDEALKLLAKRKRNLSAGHDTFTIASKAVLLTKKGEHIRARRLIEDKYKKIKNNREMNSASRSRDLNTLAWTTFEMGAVDETSLEMAKESVTLDKSGNNLDTLATLYAELGNYREAIRVGKESLSLAKEENFQSIIEEKLAQWGNMVE
jgi:thiol-disulfide isomerase/thioredoxin